VTLNALLGTSNYLRCTGTRVQSTCVHQSSKSECLLGGVNMNKRSPLKGKRKRRNNIAQNLITMASRDLTAAFIERRSAANLRRRSGDGRMKPFGKRRHLVFQCTKLFAAISFGWIDCMLLIYRSMLICKYGIAML